MPLTFANVGEKSWLYCRRHCYGDYRNGREFERKREAYPRRTEQEHGEPYYDLTAFSAI